MDASITHSADVISCWVRVLGFPAGRAASQLVFRGDDRYGLDPEAVALALAGKDPLAAAPSKRRWWEYLVAAGAVGVFAWLGLYAERPRIPIDAAWGGLLIMVTIVALIGSGVVLYRRTRFS